MKLMNLFLGAALLAGAVTASAQDAPRAYDTGPVWTWSMVEVKPGQGPAYVAVRNRHWKAARLARQKAGIETGYKMITVRDARPGEPNIILMIQYKNHAALDLSLDQNDALNKSVDAMLGARPTAEEMDKLRIQRGSATGRELVFKN